MVWYLQNPFFDKSVTPTFYVFKAAKSKMKVSLSGDGADEIAAGYGWTRGH